MDHEQIFHLLRIELPVEKALMLDEIQETLYDMLDEIAELEKEIETLEHELNELDAMLL